jgi:hypothetical protein
MTGPLRAVLAAGAAIAVVGACFWVLRQQQGDSDESRAEAPVKVPPRVSLTEAGEVSIVLSADAQEKAGIRTEALAAAWLDPEAMAYGRLQEDPSGSFTVRTPSAGTLRAVGGHEWPAVGQRLADGTVLGAVEPRLAPTDRINLADRLLAARGDREAANAAAAAAHTALARTRTLNADNKNVSDRALQEAEARAKSEDARLQAATGTVELIENALSAGAAAVKPVPIVVEHGGEVVELLARPGESVESGQTILRVTRFDRLIARVDVPAGQNVAPSVSTARIVALGNEDRPLQGERVGLAAAIDPNTQGQSFLFRVADPAGSLRPGLSVTAWLRLPGAREKGVLLPANAVIHAAGKAWVFVQLKPDQFVRKEVREARLAGRGWFTTGFTPGDRVVVTGAQVLLSEQSKSEIRVGEEGSGH